MTNYTKLVKALRHCTDNEPSNGDCWNCPYQGEKCHTLLSDAAAAIEDLQAEVKRLNMRCADCEYASKPWPELEPKRGEFEKSLHEMFDSIWDCDINHPIFQDTVGELMEAVLQAYDTVNRAKMEVQE